MVKGTRTHRALFLLTVLQYNGNLFKSLTELFIQEKRKEDEQALEELNWAHRPA